jgi:endonuclease YncB( thermonuclease family)
VVERGRASAVATLLAALVVALALAWTAGLGSYLAGLGGDEPVPNAPSSDRGASAATPQPDPAPRRAREPAPETEPRPGSSFRPSSRPSSRPIRGRTFRVVHVVDGDTVHLDNGETVRLAGIDTPEVGECGFDAATVALTRLALGRRASLGASDEDRDQYGRLLRYLDVQRDGHRVDAGLALIRRGLAVARYDSRDGYGRHPREDRYVAADAATPDPSCGGARGLIGPSPEPAPRRGCEPGYSPCVPPYPPDVDCGDLDGPVRVTGRDPHGLDADGDGTACEW